MKDNKTLIRWISAIVINFLLMVTLLAINLHPYEVSISMDENTKEAIKELSSIRTTIPNLIRFPALQLKIKGELNNGTFGRDLVCYDKEELEIFQENMRILYG